MITYGRKYNFFAISTIGLFLGCSSSIKHPESDHQSNTDLQCKDKGPGATRWLAMDPHVPLAITVGRDIREAGQSCCEPWFVKGSQWKALDRWGQIVGEARVKDGKLYDITKCFELELEIIKGDKGAGLFTDIHGQYRPQPSPEWKPSKEQQEQFAEFIKNAQVLAVPGQSSGFSEGNPPTSLDGPPFFFKYSYKTAKGDDHSFLFGVAGGPVLVVAWLDDNGRWIINHIENNQTNLDAAPNIQYLPIAVFDMNEDGSPEIIAYWKGDVSWAQIILKQLLPYGEPPGSWVRVAESVRGSTL